MKSRRYAEPARIPREQALAQVKSGPARDRMDAILSLALYDPDWRLAQSVCLEGLDDPDTDVVSTAVLGLAHVARLHRQLDLGIVLPRLESLKHRQALAGRINDALDDFATYLPQQKH